MQPLIKFIFGLIILLVITFMISAFGFGGLLFTLGFFAVIYFAFSGNSNHKK